MDLVWFVRPGENEELRYSMRSLTASIPHDNVWTVGHPPAWCVGARRIAPPLQATKFATVNLGIRQACENAAVSDPFILCNDDFFYVGEPLKEMPTMHRESLQAMWRELNRHYPNGSWTIGARDTIWHLRKLGYPDPLSYELHSPLVVHKTAMLKALDQIPFIKSPRPFVRTMASVFADLGGTETPDNKLSLLEPTVQRAGWLSCEDATFDDLQPFLHEQFPSPCQYERQPVIQYRP